LKRKQKQLRSFQPWNRKRDFSNGDNQNIEKVTGQKLNYELAGRREGDIERVWADTSYANRELGWKAETSLEDTLISAWKWREKNKKY
jgi:UDP-glucose 4-epimerase